MPKPRIELELDAHPSAIRRLATALSEPVMGFLALVALAISIGPLVFELDVAPRRILVTLEWALVGAFAFDFFLQFAFAENRRDWLLSPWRILDLLMIGGPFLSLLPGAHHGAGATLALRLLRLGRVGALATRVGASSPGRRRGLGPTTVSNMPVVARVVDGEALQSTPSDWSKCLEWTRNPGAEWLHASEVSLAHIRVAARSAGLEPSSLDEAFAADAPARLRNDGSSSLLFLWIPTVAEEGFPSVTRVRIAAVISEKGLLTATPELFDLPGSVSRLASRSPLPKRLFAVKIPLLILALARERFQYTSQRFDEELRRLEAIPISEGGRDFLEETFRLRREISATALDLGNLNLIVRALADGRSTIRGVNLAADKFADDLAAETGPLYDRVLTLKDDVKSILELHINVKGFEMNSFLKLLAIVSFLGLIPTVVGGMLGMNVIGNPWPMSLGQVAFCVGMASASAMYVFAVKGWLK